MGTIEKARDLARQEREKVEKDKSKKYFDVQELLKGAEEKETDAGMHAIANRKSIKKKKDAESKKRKIIFDEFDEFYQAGDFSDLMYLLQILDGNDRDFLKKEIERCKEKNYPQSPLLNEYLFFVVVNHKLHIRYLFMQDQSVEKRELDDVLSQITDNQKRIAELEEKLTKLKVDDDNKQTIVGMHVSVLDLSKKYIKEHIGEFAVECKSCGKILTLDGFPHWAIYKKDWEGSPFVFLWNRQLWQLVKDKQIPVAYMAFTLHTGIPGVKFTCKMRGETFPDWIDIPEQEELLKKLYEEYHETENEQKNERIDKLGI